MMSMEHIDFIKKAVPDPITSSFGWNERGGIALRISWLN